MNNVNRRQLLCALASLPVASSARASEWPAKPVKVICGYAAGGITDVVARTYAAYYSKVTGQTFFVDNRAGVGGVIGAQELKKATPDGYTLMFTTSSTLIENRVAFKALPYDPDTDFKLVTMVPAKGLVMIANPGLQISTLAEFLAYARTKGIVSFGTSGAGTTIHAATAELSKEYGIAIEPVHYRGEAPMLTDIAAQVLDFGMGTFSSVRKLLDSGKARAIAVTSRERLGELPSVRTFAEQGSKSPGLMLKGFVAIVVPAQTPEPIIGTLARMSIAAASDPSLREAMSHVGYDDIPPSTAAARQRFAEESRIRLGIARTMGLVPQ